MMESMSHSNRAVFSLWLEIEQVDDRWMGVDLLTSELYVGDSFEEVWRELSLRRKRVPRRT
jgi:hypothetical protein